LKDLISEIINKEGIIKFFNKQKGYGVINTNYPEGTYSFVLSNLNLRDKNISLDELSGKNVVFQKMENRENKKFAKNVLIIDD